MNRLCLFLIMFPIAINIDPADAGKLFAILGVQGATYQRWVERKH